MTDPRPVDCVVMQPIAETGLERLRHAGLVVHVAARPDLDALRGMLSNWVVSGRCT